jgi:hypothetical protein
MRIFLALSLLASCNKIFEGDAFDDASAADAMPGGKADDGDQTGALAPWSVSRHVFFSRQLDEDTRARIEEDLELIAELGARYVRTDLWWYAAQPTPDRFDDAVLAHYRWYVLAAERRGIGVIAIASNPPDWARQLYDSGERDEYAAAFGRYTERMAVEIGDLVTYYQLSNEPNHVIDFPDSDADVQLFVEGRAGLERGRAQIGAAVPMRTIVNVLVDGHDSPIGPRWEDDVRFYMTHGAAGAIDVVAIDHYPGTWSIGDWGGNIVDRLFGVGAEHGVAVAIGEIGYANARCAPPFNTEGGQVGWIREQLPRLRAKLADPAVTGGARLEFANWFKLDDRNSGNCFDPEDNFGVVHTDRSAKPAFEALRGEIAKFAP